MVENVQFNYEIVFKMYLKIDYFVEVFKYKLKNNRFCITQMQI